MDILEFLCSTVESLKTSTSRIVRIKRKKDVQIPFFVQYVKGENLSSFQTHASLEIDRKGKGENDESRVALRRGADDRLGDNRHTLYSLCFL